jgi:hypothetical protein
MLLKFSVKNLIQTVMNQFQSDLVLKNPRYIQKVVNESIDKAIGGEVIPSYLEKYMPNALNVGNFELNQTVQGPKEISDYLPIVDILKDMLFSNVYVLADIIIGLIDKFFNFMTSSLADFEPPALLIKIDKAVGILTNLTGSLSSIAASGADILSAMANCENFKDSDLFKYAFEQLYNSEEGFGEIQKFDLDAGVESLADLYDRIKAEYMFQFDDFDIKVEARSGTQEKTTPLAMNDVRQVINQYNGELQKIVNYKVMK